MSEQLDIRALLDATTTVYRPGPEVKVTQDKNVKVTEVWLDTPHESEAEVDDDHPLVDVHFFRCQVDRAAAQRRRGKFVALMDAWPPDPTYRPENRLASGPSYIELGSQIGTIMGQQDALRLMALGQVLGAWHVITPRRLMADMSQQDADRLAGSGLVLISGYDREKVLG